MSTRFGFLTEPVSVDWTGGCIRPLPEHATLIQQVTGHERHHLGWFYPPLASRGQRGRDGAAPPPMPVPFAMPSTHTIDLNGAMAGDVQAENFHIAVFGMLKGLRLQREGWQHFYKCPTKSCTLCDFGVYGDVISVTLNWATRFWRDNPDAATRKLAFAAIHWHLFAQLYEHEFERFQAQYSALDACWALAKTLHLLPKKVTHAERPGVLAEKLGLEVPTWATPIAGAKSNCLLSERRNALAHEALYADQPLGFAHPLTEPRMELELCNFVARCIFALLGARSSYTASRVDTRQMMPLEHIDGPPDEMLISASFTCASAAKTPALPPGGAR